MTPAARLRVIVYPLLVVLAAAVLAGRAGSGRGSSSTAGPIVTLAGMTAERRPIEVHLGPGDTLRSLRVTLVALCENGGDYRIGWNPESPRIAFTSGAYGFLVRESRRTVSAGGLVSQTLAWSRLRLQDDARVATGDLRSQTVFHYRDGRILRCDSGYVHWQAGGPGAASGGSAAAAPGYYPHVPSLAVDPPPAQLRFAALVDRTCVAAYDYGELLSFAHVGAHASRLARERAYLLAHQEQYLAIARLGVPHDGEALYRAWRSNMLRRVRLQLRAVDQLAGDHVRAWQATLDEIGYLKLIGDSLGQEFGLQVCSSNGPLSHPAGGGGPVAARAAWQ